MNTKILILLCLFPLMVCADDPHHEPIYNTKSTGVALAIAAAQCQFDFGTYRLQGCISGGSYGSNNAINFGVGKRFSKNRMLLNGSIGIEEGNMGYGAAINWRF